VLLQKKQTSRLPVRMASKTRSSGKKIEGGKPLLAFACGGASPFDAKSAGRGLGSSESGWFCVKRRLGISEKRSLLFSRNSHGGAEMKVQGNFSRSGKGALDVDNKNS